MDSHSFKQGLLPTIFMAGTVWELGVYTVTPGFALIQEFPTPLRKLLFVSFRFLFCVVLTASQMTQRITSSPKWSKSRFCLWAKNGNHFPWFPFLWKPRCWEQSGSTSPKISEQGTNSVILTSNTQTPISIIAPNPSKIQPCGRNRLIIPSLQIMPHPILLVDESVGISCFTTDYLS